MSTIKVNKIENTATADGGIAIDASGHVQVDGVQLPTGGALSGRNRIINGDMRIDQRNAGAAVTSGFPLDRWQIELFSGGGVANVEQVVDSPTDSFYYSMKVDVTTADTSLAAGDVYTVRQIIEGNNVVDLRYGLTGAKTVTVSFWVKSNLTGTFCAALRNGDNDRCKPKEYTISSANTWEKKTLTFTGDTSGTWGRTNGRGIQLSFCLGSGTTRQGTVDTWNTSEVHCTSNQTNLFASTSNEWYVTGVQLEVGEKATPFEHKRFDQELTDCCRYYQKSYQYGTAPGTTTDKGSICRRSSQSTAMNQHMGFEFRHRFRADPSVTIYNPNNGTASQVSSRGTTPTTHNSNVAVGTIFNISENAVSAIELSSSGGPALLFHYEADAEL